MTRYEDLCREYKGHVDASHEWAQKCFEFPWSVRENLQNYLGCKESFSYPGEPPIPYVHFSKLEYDEDGNERLIRTMSPNEAVWYNNDGSWTFFIGIFLETSPNRYPKDSYSVKFRFYMVDDTVEMYVGDSQTGIRVNLSDERLMEEICSCIYDVFYSNFRFRPGKDLKKDGSGFHLHRSGSLSSPE